ncbi:MAG: TSUP family transporter [Dongiaceae bacterium]
MFDWSIIAAIAAAALGTSFLSGIFGMIGGLVLMGVLLLFLPVPAAMTLHAITQMTANGWRALVWRQHVMWRIVPAYLLGSAIVFALLALVQYSPPKAWVYLCLGIMPFAARLLPRERAPDIRRRGAPILVGALVMALHVLAGVSGAALDMFFLARDLDRRLVVATKAMTQSLGHAIKFVYFALVAIAPLRSESAAVADTLQVPLWAYVMAASLAVCGTTLAKPVLHRFSNEAFQLWSRRLVLGIGGIYLVQGGVGLAQ